MVCKVIVKPLLAVEQPVIDQFRLHNHGYEEGRMLEAIDFAYNERNLGEDDNRVYRAVTAGYILDDGELHSWGLIYELYESRGVYSYHMDVYTVPKARGMGYGTLIVKTLKQLHDGYIYTYKAHSSIYTRLGM